jgi:hypothetical protein
MRTTVTLDEDVAAAVEQMRRDSGMGLSEALNELARTGLRAPRTRARFVQRTHAVGLKVDVTNVAETLELLEGPSAR